MSELQSKRFDEPDEVISLPNFTGQIVVFGEWYVAWQVQQPGWRWSEDVKPVVSTPSCQLHQ